VGLLLQPHHFKISVLIHISLTCCLWCFLFAFPELSPPLLEVFPEFGPTGLIFKGFLLFGQLFNSLISFGKRF
jgi:hypothetical protein